MADQDRSQDTERRREPGPGSRGSDKHNPRLDDQREHEVGALVQGAPDEGRSESRSQEQGGHDRPRGVQGTRPQTSERAGYGLSEPEADLRADLARHLRGAAFPAGREDLVRVAEDEGAPDELLERLRGLDAGRRYRTTQEVWEELGGYVETGGPTRS